MSIKHYCVRVEAREQDMLKWEGCGEVRVRQTDDRKGESAARRDRSL